MSETLDRCFVLGIPCKFSDVAIIPRHIYEFFDDGEQAKCRDGEIVTLELIKEYASTGEIEADLREMFGMGDVEYTSIWKKRVDAVKLHERGWVKVRMCKIEAE